MRKPLLTCAGVALLFGCSKDPKTLFGDKPDVPLPLAGLTWGMPKPDTLAGAAAAGRVIADGLYPKGYRGVVIDFFFSYPDDHLDRFDINFPEGTNAAELGEAMWGAPTVGKDDGKDMKMWLNAEKGVRAYVTKGSYDNRMFVEQYTPIETFLGDGKTLAFEAKQPIIGSTRAALLAAYKLKDGAYIYFPPSRCTSNRMSLLVHFDDHGTATGYDTRWEDGYCNLDAAVVKQVMEKKFGKPHPLAGGDPTDVYADDPNVIALAPVKAVKVMGLSLAGQGKSGLGLAVFKRPTKGRLLAQ
jgi:hypothetical protein